MNYYKDIEIALPNASQDVYHWTKLKLNCLKVIQYDFIEWTKCFDIDDESDESKISWDLMTYKRNLEFKYAVLNCLKDNKPLVEECPIITYLKPSDISIISTGEQISEEEYNNIVGKNE